MHAEDLRDLALGSQNDLIEHKLAAFVNHITVSVDEVAARVNHTSLAVNEVTIFVLVKNGLRKWAHFKVTHNVVDIELGEEEDLGEFSILEVLHCEDVLALAVNDMAIEIDQVSLLVDASADVVRERVGVATLQDNAAIGIFIEDSDNVFDVVALAVVVEKLL